MRVYVDTSKTCGMCGKTGLQWRKIDGKWRLIDLRVSSTSFIHECNGKEAAK